MGYSRADSLPRKLLHKKNNMALFTRGLTKVARSGVNTRIGAAVAFYHKNVRWLFSLVFHLGRYRIATVVSNVKRKLYCTRTDLELLPSSG